LDRIYATARELTRAMDEIVWAVNPRHDTLDSLAVYLGRFAQELLATAGIRCRLNLPVQLPQWRLTAETRHNLFLAFKEALHNVVKHAHASEARVTLTLRTHDFTLSIEDDGRGFDFDNMAPPSENLPNRPGGNGLANMRQRLRELGGRCEIRSQPGSGTTVSFTVGVRFP
ncbi:MAG: ATP-binding protein, partial [Verrucomicrobiota bacterium]